MVKENHFAKVALHLNQTRYRIAQYTRTQMARETAPSTAGRDM
jgi:hypothetical protein